MVPLKCYAECQRRGAVHQLYSGDLGNGRVARSIRQQASSMRPHNLRSKLRTTQRQVEQIKFCKEFACPCTSTCWDAVKREERHTGIADIEIQPSHLPNSKTVFLECFSNLDAVIVLVQKDSNANRKRPHGRTHVNDHVSLSRQVYRTNFNNETWYLPSKHDAMNE